MNIIKILNEFRRKNQEPKKGTGKKPKDSTRRLYTDENPKDTVRVKFKTIQDIKDTLSQTTFKSKSHARQSQIINLIHQRVRAAYQNAKNIKTIKRLKKVFKYIETRKEISKRKTKQLKNNKMKITINELKQIIRKIINEENEQSTNKEKPKLIFLIGPPSAGKSTYIEKKKYNTNPDYVIINRDEIVSVIAKNFKSDLNYINKTITIDGTYDDMFENPRIIKKLLNNIIPPTKDNFDSVVDKYIKELEHILKEFKKSEDYREYLNSIKEKIISRINAKYDNVFVGKSIQEVEQELLNNNNKNFDDIIKYMFGELQPFTKDQLEEYIVKFGYNTTYLIPFNWSKVKDANEMVLKTLESSRDSAAQQLKNIVIDMTNITIDERNTHRNKILDAINKILPSNQKETNINKLFDQVAIVFAKDEKGFTPYRIQKIKKAAKKRELQIRQQGGSKTIPDIVFDRMLSSFQKPTESEGFKSIKYIGTISVFPKSRKNISELRKIIKNIIKESYQHIKSGDIDINIGLIIAKVNEFLKRLNKNIEVRSIYHVGSSLTGHYGKSYSDTYGDIDIAVLLSDDITEENEDIWFNSEEYEELNSLYNYDVFIFSDKNELYYPYNKIY